MLFKHGAFFFGCAFNRCVVFLCVRAKAFKEFY